MSKSILSILVNTKEWEKKAQKCAAEGLEFWLLNLQPEHFDFCRKLCREFNYEYQFRSDGNQATGTFRPLAMRRDG